MANIVGKGQQGESTPRCCYPDSHILLQTSTFCCRLPHSPADSHILLQISTFSCTVPQESERRCTCPWTDLLQTLSSMPNHTKFWTPAHVLVLQNLRRAKMTKKHILQQFRSPREITLPGLFHLYVFRGLVNSININRRSRLLCIFLFIGSKNSQKALATWKTTKAGPTLELINGELEKHSTKRIKKDEKRNSHQRPISGGTAYAIRRHFSTVLLLIR